MKTNKKFGWTPDLPDPRDFVYSLPKAFKAEILPALVDLRITGLLPPVMDQKNLGSCTANALSACFQYSLDKQNIREFKPSRLFIYYNERVMIGTVSEDSGAMIRDGIKSMATQGVCPEYRWPYLIPKFANKPFPSCYRLAEKNLIQLYERIPRSLYMMKARLFSGYPFVFGFTVFDSFMNTDASGITPTPDFSSESILGGHAVTAVGYDDASQRMLCLNSWGSNWGDKGFFTLPYEYFTNENLSDDFWAITFVVRNK